MMDLTLKTTFDSFTYDNGRRIWLLDSASSCMVACDKREFTSITMFEKPKYIGVGGGHNIPVLGVGICRILANCHGKYCDTSITEVKYSPDMGANILSVTVLNLRGYDVSFKANGQGTVTDSYGNVVLTTTRHHGMNVVNMGITLDEATCEQVLAMNQTIDKTFYSADHHKEIPKAALIHQRFGHCGVNKLRTMGFKLDTFGICEPCILAKTKRQCNVGPATRVANPYEKFHCDTAGPINPPALITGSKFFNVMIDDCTGFKIVHALTSKAQAYDKITDLITTSVRDGHVVKAVHSDHGGEYTSKKLKNFLNQHNVLLSYSSVGTPEQNGRAEKAIGDLTRAAQANLFHSGLPPHAWELAVLYAADQLNALQTDKLGGKSPYEVFHGSPPPTHHFRVFGCNAWTRITTKVKKFDPKARPCVFVGIIHENCYLLLDWNRKMTYQARDVTFDEADFSEALRVRKDLCPNFSTEEEVYASLEIDQVVDTCEEDSLDLKFEKDGGIITSGVRITESMFFSILFFLLVILLLCLLKSKD